MQLLQLLASYGITMESTDDEVIKMLADAKEGFF